MRKATNPNTPVTAKDIGRELGLSQPTVSRVLAGAKGHRVSTETSRRVFEAADRMGYRPNAIARSLRRRRTNIVGFYTGHHYLDARNAFLASLIGGLQRAGDAHELDILLHGVFRGRTSDAVFAELMDGRVDGLFVHTHADDPLVERLRDSSLPVVAIADAIPGIPTVVCDDADGIRQLIDYLWAKGHRRIAYLKPFREFYAVETRVNAFVAELDRRGACRASCPVISIDLENASAVLPMLRKNVDHPTAVCCWNDMAAYDLLHACYLAGVSVPEDLAVAGFDGFLDPRLTPCPLVTVAASWEAVAECAMAHLVRQINGDGDEAEPERGPFPPIHSEEVIILSRLPVTLVPGATA